MNVKSTIIKIAFGFILGLALCGSLFFTVVKRNYNKRIDDMSSEISSSTSINEQLRATSADLERRNNELTATVAGLREQITSDNRRNKQTIDGLKSTIKEISVGIDSASGTVGEVIKRLEDIKTEVSDLK